MKTHKRILFLALALTMLFALAAPASAAGNGIAVKPGHELLAYLPATLQKPARPTTLEQAEGRFNSRMVTVENEEAQKEEYREWYRDAFGEEPTEEQVANSTIACPVPWTLSQSKESVFREIVTLTEQLTAGKSTDTEKVKAVFDWVSQNITYDYTAYQYCLWKDAGYWLNAEQEARLEASADPFYAYVNKLAICDGYSDISWLMLCIAQIPAVRIVGESNEAGLNGGGPHAWNAALLDGRWLFFDATWKEWDMAPDYHKTSEGMGFCDGAFQETIAYDSWDGSFPVSYWLCPGFQCPANVVMPEGCWDVMAESFKDCTTLKSITLPSTCTSIQTEAFAGCTGLEKVVIPEGVVSIGGGAFRQCSSLRDVTIPKSVTHIGDAAFYLTPWLKNQGEWPIFGGILLAYQGPDVESITVPDGVREIASRAFYYNGSNIRKITFPASLTKIGEWMVSHSYLEEVNFLGTKEQWDAVEIVPDGGTNWKLRDEETVLHCMNETSVPAIVSTGVNPEATGTAYASTQTVKVDGKAVEFQMYALKNASGDETNYVKLRDLADVLDGTKAQFNVTWAEATGVGVQTGTAYTQRNGQEGKTPYSGNRGYKKGDDTTQVNGAAVPLQAFVLTDDGGGESTYYKLRDLGQALGFNVYWQDGTGVVLETGRPYTGTN